MVYHIAISACALVRKSACSPVRPKGTYVRGCAVRHPGKEKELIRQAPIVRLVLAVIHRISTLSVREKGFEIFDGGIFGTRVVYHYRFGLQNNMRLRKYTLTSKSILNTINQVLTSRSILNTMYRCLRRILKAVKVSEHDGSTFEATARWGTM